MPALVEDRQQRAQDFNQRCGEKLRYWRYERDASQAWLAEMADMSTSSLSRAESGERALTLRQGYIICKLLEIEIDDLIDPDQEF